MIQGIATGAGKAGKAGLEEIKTLATQRVIGYTKTTTRRTKNKVITKNENIGIQAWEIGAVLAGGAMAIGSIGAYEWLTGNPITKLKGDLTGITKSDYSYSTGEGLPAPNSKPNFGSNLINFFKVIFP